MIAGIAKSQERGGVLLWVLLGLGLVILLAVSYLAIVLNWAYSEGERAGIVQKLSRKGWLCKTWEGELAMFTTPGVPPEIWRFSVREDDVVVQVSAALGKRAVLHYTEHRGVPLSCFGETRYFVNGVRVDEAAAAAAPEL